MQWMVGVCCGWIDNGCLDCEDKAFLCKQEGVGFCFFFVFNLSLGND
jgi:hypothetical protein